MLFLSLALGEAPCVLREVAVTWESFVVVTRLRPVQLAGREVPNRELVLQAAVWRLHFDCGQSEQAAHRHR